MPKDQLIYKLSLLTTQLCPSQKSMIQKLITFVIQFVQFIYLFIFIFHQDDNNNYEITSITQTGLTQLFPKLLANLQRIFLPAQIVQNNGNFVVYSYMIVNFIILMLIIINLRIQPKFIQIEQITHKQLLKYSVWIMKIFIMVSEIMVGLVGYVVVGGNRNKKNKDGGGNDMQMVIYGLMILVLYQLKNRCFKCVGEYSLYERFTFVVVGLLLSMKSTLKQLIFSLFIVSIITLYKYTSLLYSSTFRQSLKFPKLFYFNMIIFTFSQIFHQIISNEQKQSNISLLYFGVLNVFFMGYLWRYQGNVDLFKYFMINENGNKNDQKVQIIMRNCLTKFQKVNFLGIVKNVLTTEEMVELFMILMKKDQNVQNTDQNSKKISKKTKTEKSLFTPSVQNFQRSKTSKLETRTHFEQPSHHYPAQLTLSGQLSIPSLCLLIQEYLISQLHFQPSNTALKYLILSYKLLNKKSLKNIWNFLQDCDFNNIINRDQMQFDQKIEYFRLVEKVKINYVEMKQNQFVVVDLMKKEIKCVRFEGLVKEGYQKVKMFWDGVGQAYWDGQSEDVGEDKVNVVDLQVMVKKFQEILQIWDQLARQKAILQRLNVFQKYQHQYQTLQSYLNQLDKSIIERECQKRLFPPKYKPAIKSSINLFTSVSSQPKISSTQFSKYLIIQNQKIISISSQLSREMNVNLDDVENTLFMQLFGDQIGGYLREKIQKWDFKCGVMRNNARNNRNSNNSNANQSIPLAASKPQFILPYFMTQTEFILYNIKIIWYPSLQLSNKYILLFSSDCQNGSEESFQLKNSKISMKKLDGLMDMKLMVLYNMQNGLVEGYNKEFVEELGLDQKLISRDIKKERLFYDHMFGGSFMEGFLELIEVRSFGEKQQDDTSKLQQTMRMKIEVSMNVEKYQLVKLNQRLKVGLKVVAIVSYGGGNQSEYQYTNNTSEDKCTNNRKTFIILQISKFATNLLSNSHKHKKPLTPITLKQLQQSTQSNQNSLQSLQQTSTSSTISSPNPSQQSPSKKYSNEEFFCPIQNSYMNRIHDRIQLLKQNGGIRIIHIMRMLFVVMVLMVCFQMGFGYFMYMDRQRNGLVVEESISGVSETYNLVLQMYRAAFRRYEYLAYPENVVRSRGVDMDTVGSMCNATKYNQNLFIKQFMFKYLYYFKSQPNYEIDYNMFFPEFNISTSTSKTTLIDFIQNFQRNIKNQQTSFILSNYVEFRQLVQRFQKQQIYDEKIMDEMMMMMRYLIMIGVGIGVGGGVVVGLGYKIQKCCRNVLDIYRKIEKQEVKERIREIQEDYQRYFGEKKQILNYGGGSEQEKRSTQEQILTKNNEDSNQLIVTYNSQDFNNLNNKKPTKTLRKPSKFSSIKPYKQKQSLSTLKSSSNSQKTQEHNSIKKFSNLLNFPLTFRTRYFHQYLRLIILSIIFLSFLMIILYETFTLKSQVNDTLKLLKLQEKIYQKVFAVNIITVDSLFQPVYRHKYLEKLEKDNSTENYSQNQLKLNELLKSKQMNLEFYTNIRSMLESGVDENASQIDASQSVVLQIQHQIQNILRQNICEMNFTQKLKLKSVQLIKCQQFGNGILTRGFSESIVKYVQYARKVKQSKLSQFQSSPCTTQFCPTFFTFDYMSFKLNSLTGILGAIFRTKFIQIQSSELKQKNVQLLIKSLIQIILLILLLITINYVEKYAVKVLGLFKMYPYNVIKKMRVTNYVRRMEILKEISYL